MTGQKRKGSSETKSQKAVGKPTVFMWLGINSGNTLLLYVLLAAVLGSGLLVVRTTHENRFAFNELQQLRDDANRYDVEWGQLLLEQSTFGLDGRIEQKAIEQLQMQLPDMNEIVMVERNAR